MAAKTDPLRKRLLSSGLGPDIVTKYIDVLRDFLCARTTKPRFEAALRAVLPSDKISLHNAIIHELLSRSMSRRDGLRDLPVLTPARDRRPVVPPRKHEPTLATKRPPVKPEVHRPKLAIKRPSNIPTLSATADDEEPPSSSVPVPIPTPTTTAPPVTSTPTLVTTIPTPAITATATAAAAATTTTVTATPTPTITPARRPAPIDDTSSTGAQPSAKRAKIAVAPRRKEDGTRKSEAERPSPKQKIGRRRPDGSAATAGPSGPMRPAEIETYDSLPFTPVRPGQTLDYELFFRMRARLRFASEQLGAHVRDDAVGIMTHAVELRVKQMLQAALARRTAKVGRMPSRGMPWTPVTGLDVRQAALAENLLEGNMVELEKLTMLW